MADLLTNIAEKDSDRSRNSRVLSIDYKWLHAVISRRFRQYFKDDSFNEFHDIQPATLEPGQSVYSDLILSWNLDLEERLVLLLALAPHLHPQILDIFFTKNKKFERGFSEFGGLKGKNHSGFLPTGETAAFVISGVDLTSRFRVMAMFSDDHVFKKKRILHLDLEDEGEPALSGALQVSNEVLSYITTGKEYRPNFSMKFPAQRLTTKLEWEDLVIEESLLDEVQEIKAWIQHKDQLLNNPKIGKHIKEGYRSLFYGPPGTGKTLTASLLGKEVNMDVYRVDLSKVVSKYIGETEKNLANIFDSAEHKNWILFFDEADALFGKRTATNDSKDRFANQEIAFLLQRIENFSGVVILATNLKKNIDEAFARRFQSMLYFPIPKLNQRVTLWKNSFSGLELDSNIDFRSIARQFEVAGGAIINVMRYCALQSARSGHNKILLRDILEGIRKEFHKEGKTMT